MKLAVIAAPAAVNAFSTTTSSNNRVISSSSRSNLFMSSPFFSSSIEKALDKEVSYHFPEICVGVRVQLMPGVGIQFYGGISVNDEHQRCRSGREVGEILQTRIIWFILL